MHKAKPTAGSALSARKPLLGYGSSTYWCRADGGRDAPHVLEADIFDRLVAGKLGGAGSFQNRMYLSVDAALADYYAAINQACDEEVEVEEKKGEDYPAPREPLFHRGEYWWIVGDTPGRTSKTCTQYAHAIAPAEFRALGGWLLGGSKVGVAAAYATREAAMDDLRKAQNIAAGIAPIAGSQLATDAEQCAPEAAQALDPFSEPDLPRKFAETIDCCTKEIFMDDEDEAVDEMQSPDYCCKTRDGRIVLPSGGDPRFMKLLGQMAELHCRKANDYGAGEDFLSNLRGSDAWGVPMWVATMVRAHDKLKRLQNMAKSVTLKCEPARDSFLDLACYALLALVLFDEHTAHRD